MPLVRIPSFFFFSSRRRHTRYWRDWSSDVCSSDLLPEASPGRRAFLIVPDSVACAFYILFGNASVGNWHGDPLLARLLSVARAGDVASLATRVSIKDASALCVASVVPPDAVEPL